MYILKVTDKSDWAFGVATYYEYTDEKMVLEAARKLAEKGVDTMVYKPYKKFEKPKPEVVEIDV